MKCMEKSCKKEADPELWLSVNDSVRGLVFAFPVCEKHYDKYSIKLGGFNNIVKRNEEELGDFNE